jgi:hypothetical protein
MQTHFPGDLLGLVVQAAGFCGPEKYMTRRENPGILNVQFVHFRSSEERA